VSDPQKRQAGASFRVTITPQVEAAIADALERMFDLFEWEAKHMANVAVEAMRDSISQTPKRVRKAGRIGPGTQPTAL
jgi:hypothetical protein